MFAKTRVPDVLFLIVLGLVLGPTLGILTPEDFGKIGPVMTTLALIVILFDSGTRLQLPDLKASVGDTLSLGLATFFATAILATLIARGMTTLDWLPAMMLGTTVGGTSSVVVIPLIQALKVREPSSTVLVTESVLTDVLTIIGLVALLQAYQQGSVDVGRVLGSLLAALLLAAAIGVVGAVGWLALLTTVRRYPNTLSTSLGFALVLYGVAELLGYSGPIAVLAFGVALANQEDLRLTRIAFIKGQKTSINDDEKAFHAELVFIFKIFFFVYLGLSIILAPKRLLLAAAITLAAYVARLFLTRVLLSREAVWSDAAVVSYMVPKGLAAAVIAGLPLQAAVPGGEVIRDAAYQVVLFSILATVAMIPIAERTVLRRGYRRLFARFKAEPPADDPAVA